MLPPANRLRSSTAFAAAVRRGRRAGTSTLVLHLASRDGVGSVPEPHVGFVVSKAVGSAVTRNLVKRRLRSLAREHLRELPGSAVLVVRAQPAAGSAAYADLAADFSGALARLGVRSSERSSVGEVS